jgi:Ca2+-binding EF-hand superfamily protein
MEDLLFKYKSELKNKIELQGIKNKPFSQILLQSFKYFDKNSSGLCNYDTFIKVNKKFDIILEPQEFQKIFFYYDVNNEEIIYYNDLINDIFNSNDNDNIINLNYEDENSQNNILNNLSNISNKNSNNIPPYKKPFFEKIINNLLNNELGPSIALLIFYQGFILADNNYIQKFTLKEFVKIMNDNDINLSISDIQTLFHTYNLNNDGFFYYEKMFEDIINKYMNNQRKKIIQNSIEEIMNKLNKIAKGKINLFNLQNYI